MDTTLADTLVGRVLDGRYRIQERIARGGMATVYRAVDLRLDRPVAVKVMHSSLAEDPDFVSRFTREAKSAARLSHPNVVAVFDQGSDSGVVFLVMEYVQGVTLRDVVKEHGRLSPRQALDILAPVLSALGAAHAAGIVHRDIKPENVLIASDGRIKVADFGLARAIADSNLTATSGLLIGTAAYLAPEQIEHGTADPRTDLYAAGIVLYELLTGKPPYEGPTPMAVVFKHVHERVPAPSLVRPEVPRQIDVLVLDATQRDPADRPPTAAELLEQLQAAARTLPPEPLDLTQPTQVLGEHLTTVLRSEPGPAHTLVVPPDWPPAPPAVGDTRPRWPWLRGWRLAVLLLVLLTLAAAATGAYLGIHDRARHSAGTGSPSATTSAAAPAETLMPNFFGMTKTAADQKALTSQVAVSYGPDQFSDQPTGKVISQTQTAGAQVALHTLVQLTLSKGPKPVDIPSTLTGQTVDQAKTTLAAANLTLGKHTSEYNDTIAANAIVRVATTGPVAPGTAIEVVLSRGPAPVAVPREQGKSATDAAADLKAKGFPNVTTSQDYSDTVDKGNVISQTPAPPASIQQSASVTLVISKGPELFLVPNLYKDTPTQAQAELDKVGMVAKFNRLVGTTGGHVLHQSIPAGSYRRHGTVVTVDIF
ncbi:MAG: eukaryotic-like serine/threonine-protein kinase [Frankiales bacterium]|nr:eukaryotic-like serine/threonine-protein kinase [Frankiales bacterium]